MGKPDKAVQNGLFKSDSSSAAEVADLKSEKVSVSSSELKRSYIPLPLKRKLYAEAQGCCQYESSNGVRCGSQFQIQLDHVTPVFWGGDSSPKNLRLLCRTHNLLVAQQMRLS